MATSQIGPDFSYEAAADLSGAQYTVVRLSGANQVNLATSPRSNMSAHRPVGILQNKPDAAGKGAAVRAYGRSVMVAGAAISAGDEVTYNSSGRGITANTVGEFSIGTAVTAASADGEHFEVALNISWVSTRG